MRGAVGTLVAVGAAAEAASGGGPAPLPLPFPAPPAAVPDRFLAGKPRVSPSVQLRGNWEAFWAQVDKDHSHAALVWNELTRAELRESLQVSELLVLSIFNLED